MHTYVSTHTHTYICTHIHIHIYTYVYVFSWEFPAGGLPFAGMLSFMLRRLLLKSLSSYQHASLIRPPVLTLDDQTPNTYFPSTDRISKDPVVTSEGKDNAGSWYYSSSMPDSLKALLKADASRQAWQKSLHSSLFISNA